jgi:Zn-dependent M28 family amino/carboxypeptidase
VVLFANEENGFDGANTYAKVHKDEVHQLVGESDFGAGQVWRLRHRVSDASAAAFAPLGRLLGPLGIAYSFDGDANKGSPGPDAGVISRANGWPGVELSQDGTNYFDLHHTENDTIDKINPATLPQNVAAWATTAWLAAQSAVPFGPIAVPPR